MRIDIIEIVDENGLALVQGKDFKSYAYTDECGNNHMKVTVKNLDFDEYEKGMLLKLIYDKIDYGTDLEYARKLIQLYDKINNVENNINE